MSKILKLPKIINDAVLVTSLDSSPGSVGEELAILPDQLIGVEAMLRGARAKQDSIMDTAHKEAARMLSEAQSTLSRLQEEARERGYEDGWNKGVNVGKEEIAQAVDAICRVAQSAHLERSQLMKESELNIAALAIDVAKAIIGEEVALNPNIPARIVEKAIDKIDTENAVKIRLNPEDLKLLTPHWKKSSGPGGKPMQWEAVEDETVARGGCVIDTKLGTVDAQVDTQLWKIGRSFFELT
ncbi:MAG: FliH/SctL family protein [Chloroflexota bacterium]